MNYKVEAKIDGQWFNNAKVYPTRTTAVAAGDELTAYGSIGDYRVVLTADPVTEPEKAEESAS